VHTYATYTVHLYKYTHLA